MEEMDSVINVAQSASTGVDISMVSLFFQATFTVKIVILLLSVASIWCWAIIFSKFSMFSKLKKNAAKFEELFWNSPSLDSMYDRVNKSVQDPFVSVFVAGMHEWKSANNKVKSIQFCASLTERIDRIMRVALGRDLEKIEKHVGFLATVASTAPFVGLFGTVWGIMNVMSSMTNIAHVAAGIAEALFATALGLIVTIPAAIAYNKISLEISRYEEKLEDFIGEFSAIISRAIENSECASCLKDSGCTTDNRTF